MIVRQYHYEVTEEGFDELVDESAVPFLPEDLSEDESLVQVVAKHLLDQGVCFPSSSVYTPRMWYDTEDSMNPYTGVVTRSSFFLEGLTPEQEEEVFGLITHR